eukprot:COSAG03_NODE_1625_length_3752_cov_136.402233_4_plen_76_part_00
MRRERMQGLQTYENGPEYDICWGEDVNTIHATTTRYPRIIPRAPFVQSVVLGSCRDHLDLARHVEYYLERVAVKR